MTGGVVARRGTSTAKAWALYATTTIALVAVVGWLLTLAFDGPGDAAAVRLSAAVAIVVQLAAFGVTRAIVPSNLIAGWGAGSLVRFLTLAIYALLAVKVLGVAPVAALLSLATFLFLATLIEPLFLRR
jgi:hypothetical protein